MKIATAKKRVARGYGCSLCEYDDILRVLILAVEALKKHDKTGSCIYDEASAVLEAFEEL